MYMNSKVMTVQRKYIMPTSIFQIYINCTMKACNQNYYYLIQCLKQGSDSFKLQAIQQLIQLSQNRNKHFSAYCKSILAAIDHLYAHDPQQISLGVTKLFIQIVSNYSSYDLQAIIAKNHTKNLIFNLGHPNNTSLRKASHNALRLYLKSYNNFQYFCKLYLIYGINCTNQLVRRKSINSLQSIILNEPHHFDWNAKTSGKLLSTLISYSYGDNTQIVAAASQCLLTLCRMEGIKELIKQLPEISLQQLSQFLENTPHKANLMIQPQDISCLIAYNKEHGVQADESTLKLELENIQNLQLSPTGSHHSGVRFDRIKPSKCEQKIYKNIHKEPVVHAKPLKAFNAEEGIQKRIDSAEQLQFNIQNYAEKQQFECSVKAIFPSIVKMMHEANPKVLRAALSILETLLGKLNRNDPQLSQLMGTTVQRLGDARISIRQMVGRAIKKFIATSRQSWVHLLMNSLAKEANPFIKIELLSMIEHLYKNYQDIDYPIQSLLKQIAELTEDAKFKIRMHALDCLVLISALNDLQECTIFLKDKMSPLAYQMYLEKAIAFKGKQKEKDPDQNNDLPSQEKQSHSEYKSVQVSREKSSVDSHLKRYSGAESNQQTNPQKQTNSLKKRRVNLNSDMLRVSIQAPKKRLRKKIVCQSAGEADSPEAASFRSIRPADGAKFVLPSLNNKQRASQPQKGSLLLAPPTRVKNIGSEYVPKQSLQPLPNPQSRLKTILCDLKENNWKILFDSLSDLRRIIQFHSEIIKNSSSNEIHELIMGVLTQVENLRSSVSKNALLCFNQLASILYKQLDPTVEAILQKLMKKSADTNVFIGDEVQKCLAKVGINATSGKILDQLQLYKDSKSIPVKQALLTVLQAMIQEDKIKDKEYPKLIDLLCSLLGDGHLETRTRAKTLVIELCQRLRNWQKLLQKKIKPNNFKSVYDLMTKSSNNKIAENSPRRQLHYKSKSVNLNEIVIEKQLASPKRQLKMRSPLRKPFPKLDGVAGWLEESKSSDWKLKIQGLKSIKEAAIQYPNEFAGTKLATLFVDAISKQIVDLNTKVSVHAMQVLEAIIEPLKELVLQNISSVCAAVFSALGNSKLQVREQAEWLVQSLLQQFGIQSLLHCFCHGAQYALPKSRAYLLSQLDQQLQNISQKKLVSKHLFPLINHLMEESKPELKPQLCSLLASLYEWMGSQILSKLQKPKQARELIGLHV